MRTALRIGGLITVLTLTTAPPTLAVIAFALAGGITGCASVAPGAEQVKLTRDPKVTVGCKIVTSFSFKEGPAGAGDKASVLNFAYGAGGDTVFMTSPGGIGTCGGLGTCSGMVYHCNGTDLRQPVPVTNTTPPAEEKK